MTKEMAITRVTDVINEKEGAERAPLGIGNCGLMGGAGQGIMAVLKGVRRAN